MAAAIGAAAGRAGGGRRQERMVILMQETGETAATCNFLAQILGGQGTFENGGCTVWIPRGNVSAAIGGRPFRQLGHRIRFEPPDADGNALVTGELLLLEQEAPNMVYALSQAGIITSALQNHWILDQPRLLYAQIMAAANRVDFANKLARILGAVTQPSPS